MRKVGVVTSANDNIGSVLQCYATLTVLSRLGYEGVQLKREESALGHWRTQVGRYAQFLFRCLQNSHRLGTLIANREYARTSNHRVGADGRAAMTQFAARYLNSESASFDELKRRATRPEYVAFLSGSDQIWSARGPYLHPMAFLRFAPREKRIAWAPSFGATEIPAYCRKELAQYISGYNYLSVREQSGAAIIRDLTGREAQVLLDPTLQLNGSIWRNVVAEHSEIGKPSTKYIFLYFLSPPNPIAIKTIARIREQTSYELLTMLCDADDWGEVGTCKSVSGGPFDFVSLIANAALVCTDSFHGTTLSIDLNTPFLSFDREYGGAFAFNDQSTRLSSILSICRFEDRFLRGVPAKMSGLLEMDFTASNRRLDLERKKAIAYLSTSIQRVEAELGCVRASHGDGSMGGQAVASAFDAQGKEADV